MGTPEFAVPSLRAVAKRCEVRAVVTGPDRPRGRGRKVGPSAVAEEAERLGLEIFKTDDANHPDRVAELRALEPDLLAVVAFGTILSPELLALPRLGSINLHGSLLPEYRGASPVHRALWDGRNGTGVTTQWISQSLDTGDVIFQRWEPIRPEDDAGTLSVRLAERGAPLLAESLVLAHEGRAPRRPQDASQASYARKLGKRDGVVDWAIDARSVWNRQRAVTPWPGATTALGDHSLILIRTQPEHPLPIEERPGTVLEVDKDGVLVACRPGALRLLVVRPAGRGDQAAADWARGARVSPGMRLGAPQGAPA